LRLVALETGPEGPRAWLQDLEAGELRSVVVGDELDGATVTGLDPDAGAVELRRPNPDMPPERLRRLLEPNVLVRWHALGTLVPELLEGRAGECPRYLDRVEGEAAVVVGDAGERRLGTGQRLCGDWRVAELRGPGPETPEGLLVLDNGGRRLVLRPAWP
jgi:hypothetical protein